jgi:hypothetical protein
MPASDPALEQTDLAAAEAGAIGGDVSSDPAPVDGEEPDQAQRPLEEAGQGESDGFELAERELIEHASHSDEHAARRAIYDAPDSEEGEGELAADGGDPDYERSSERGDDRVGRD